MSYDILFVPRRPGQPWEQALDEAEGRDGLAEAVGEERLQQWARIVEVLRRRTGEVAVTAQDDALEATCSSGLQVSLFPAEAALSFPYRDRDDAAAFHDLVVDLVGVLERETGLSAWDAQTAEPFDGRVHDAPGVAATRRLAQEASDSATTDAMAEQDQDGAPGPRAADHLPHAGDGSGASVTGGSTEEPGAPVADTARQLARERRRALRYLVIGAVVVVGALLLRSQEEPSTLSWLALAVGVADLVIGGLLYRGWLRRSAASR